MRSLPKEARVQYVLFYCLQRWAVPVSCITVWSCTSPSLPDGAVAPFTFICHPRTQVKTASDGDIVPVLKQHLQLHPEEMGPGHHVATKLHSFKVTSWEMVYGELCCNMASWFPCCATPSSLLTFSFLCFLHFKGNFRAHLVECLLSTNEAVGLVLTPQAKRHEVPTCNPRA